MKKITLNETKDFYSLADNKRDADGNIIIEGATWSEVIDKINELNLFGRGATTREALDNMISRYESLNDIKLILPIDKDTETLARDFIMALANRGVLKIGG